MSLFVRLTVCFLNKKDIQTINLQFYTKKGGCGI